MSDDYGGGDRQEDRYPEYEYELVEHTGDTSLEEILNEWGTDGWRFVDYVKYDTLHFVVFERVSKHGVVSITRSKSDEERKGLLGGMLK